MNSLCLSSGIVSPAHYVFICVFVNISVTKCVPLLVARKSIPVSSNWVHCLALLSPDCGSVLFPIGGTLSLNSDYVNDLSCLLYSSVVVHPVPVH